MGSRYRRGPILVLRERRVRKALAIVENQSVTSVREVARAVSLTPDHLERLVKQETGQHLRDVLTESRLQKAAYLLVTTEMAVKEIAFAMGYMHVSSFVRAFERRFSTSPQRYRLKMGVVNS